jgi:hypothetical protein
MEFGKKLGMKRVYVAPKNDIFMNEENENFDFRFNSLHEFAMKCKNLILD